MKTFYLTLAMAAVAFSASAVSVEDFKKEKPQRTQSTSSFVSSDFSFKKVLEAPETSANTTKSFVGARKADAVNSIEGVWTFQFGDYYFLDSKGVITADYEAEILDNYLFFTPVVQNGNMPFSCPYTEGQTELVFKDKTLSAVVSEGGMNFYIYQQPYKYNWTTQDMDLQDLVGTYDPEDQLITFPADSGIAWMVYSNANPLPEYFDSYADVWDFEGAYMKNTEAWINIGEALFSDGWALPGFGIDQTLPENQYYVPLQQHKINKFLFRLVDPYHVGPFDVEALGEDALSNTVQGKVGYIQFDISDAKHVVFDKVDAAFGGGSGINVFNKFYCYNYIKWYMNIQGVSFYDAVMAFDMLPGWNPCTVFEDNTVKLSYTVRDGGDLCYDANFGMAKTFDGAAAQGGYAAMGPDGKPANVTAFIKFPDDYVYTAVEDVFEDRVDDNAPVEYFNVQGMRVANPEPGQLLIKRQGDKSEKIIIR